MMNPPVYIAAYHLNWLPDLNCPCPSFGCPRSVIWIFGASGIDVCGQLHKVACSELDFFMKGLATALKEAQCKLFPGGHLPFFPLFFSFCCFILLLPGYPAFCVSQLAGNEKDLHGVNPTNEHAASHALCGLHAPGQIANGVCTIEQVKLAASLWFSKDERNTGFCFTWQPGLVSSEKGSGGIQGRTSGGSRI